MRSTLATVFRAIFKISALKHTYFGFHKRLFKPAGLFINVHKTILYRNKIRLELNLEDFIQEHLYFLNEYEEKEIRFLENTLREGDTFIDIGANMGLFSLVASNKVGKTGKVIAFEPFPRNYNKLNRHIDINEVANITAEQMAVSDHPGSILLHLDPEEKNLGMVSSYVDKPAESIEVPATSLDHYLSAQTLTPALIKIDIEGAEFAALRGMGKTLEQYKPLLLVEINPDVQQKTGHSQAEIEQFLQEAGYHKYFLDNTGNIITTRLTEDDSNNYLFSPYTY